MQYKKFGELWEEYVVAPLESASGEKINQAFASKEITFQPRSQRKVYNKYERIKTVFKQCYFSVESNSPPLCTVDRHKRAALLCYAFNEVSPLSIDLPNNGYTPDFKVFFANQYIAFHLGLCSMLLDYKNEAFSRIENSENSGVFRFPIANNPNISAQYGITAEGSYLSQICKDLFFAKEFRNFNILNMANIFFLLEDKYCIFKSEDLYDDVSPHINSCEEYL